MDRITDADDQNGPQENAGNPALKLSIEIGEFFSGWIGAPRNLACDELDTNVRHIPLLL